MESRVLLVGAFLFSIVSCGGESNKSVLCDFTNGPDDVAKEVVVSLSFNEGVVAGTVKEGGEIVENIHANYKSTKVDGYETYSWSLDLESKDNGDIELVGRTDKVSQFRGAYYYEGGETVFFEYPDDIQKSSLRIRPCSVVGI